MCDTTETGPLPPEITAARAEGARAMIGSHFRCYFRSGMALRKVLNVIEQRGTDCAPQLLAILINIFT